MKWDQNSGRRRLPWRGAEVPRHPPHRGSCFPFLTYPPTVAQWRARPGGLWGGFLNPAKLICMGFAKNGLASSQPRNHAEARREAGEGGQKQGRPRRSGANRSKAVFFASQSPHCPPLPHIPADRGAVARTARRALGWISRSRKTHFVCVSRKMGSRARELAHSENARRAAYGLAKRPRQGC